MNRRDSSAPAGGMHVSTQPFMSLEQLDHWQNFKLLVQEEMNIANF